MNLRHYLVVASSLLLLVACGQPGQIVLEQAKVGGFGEGDAGAREANVQEQIRACREMSAANKLQTHTQSIRFEDTKVESGRNQVCLFADEGKDLDGNLSIMDSFLRARYVQDKSIDLPANAVLCDMDIESPEQDFTYDDMFFLNFNSQILASNHKSKLIDVLTPEKVVHTGTGRGLSFYTYDWLKLRNTKFENEANDFCMGAGEGLSQCQWPVTEEFGKIKLNFDSEILIRMSQKRVSNQQQISLIITGDNDRNIDCYHQRIDMKISVKYFLK